MDLLRILEVMRRRWLLTLLGVLAGCALAFATSFTVVRGNDGGYGLKSKSRTIYQTEAEFMVSAPDWSIGRAGLDRNANDGFRRTVDLAPTYATLSVSDVMVRSATGGTGPAVQFEAEAVKDSPVIRITATGNDPQRLVAATEALFEGFNAFLKDQQAKYDIPAADRLSVSMLAAPSPPVSQQSRGLEVALLAFIVPLIAAVALEFLLDANRDRRLGRLANHNAA